MKKVTIASKPQASANRKPLTTGSKRARPLTEPIKRLTVDVSLPLHTRIKTQCAMKGDKMADVIRELLEKQFREKLEQARGGRSVAN